MRRQSDAQRAPDTGGEENRGVLDNAIRGVLFPHMALGDLAGRGRGRGPRERSGAAKGNREGNEGFMINN